MAAQSDSWMKLNSVDLNIIGWLRDAYYSGFFKSGKKEIGGCPQEMLGHINYFISEVRRCKIVNTFSMRHNAYDILVFQAALKWPVIPETIRCNVKWTHRDKERDPVARFLCKFREHALNLEKLSLDEVEIITQCGAFANDGEIEPNPLLYTLDIILTAQRNYQWYTYGGKDDKPSRNSRTTMEYSETKNLVRDYDGYNVIQEYIDNAMSNPIDAQNIKDLIFFNT